jgi:prolyl-tRNA synthetase
MKDMYTFARSQEEHLEMYEKAAAAYTRVYERLGIGDTTYRTAADGGYFTDKFSDEYQTLSDIGEDTIYVHEGKRVAVNKEVYTDENLAKLGLNKDELVEKRAVEVGNIFPLESKYSDALDLYYTDEAGERHSIIMGCYGIGISRLVGLLAEHFADDKGLVWPESVAPAKVYLARINRPGDTPDVTDSADSLYRELTEKNIAVLYDDRDVRAGEKFADADLLGIPYRVVVSDKTVAADTFEVKARTSDEVEHISRHELMQKLGA